MTKLFTCDNCGDQFNWALDEEKYVDEHGVVYVFDLCAKCRKQLNTDKQKPVKEYFDKVITNKKK